MKVQCPRMYQLTGLSTGLDGSDMLFLFRIRDNIVTLTEKKTTSKITSVVVLGA